MSIDPRLISLASTSTDPGSAENESPPKRRQKSKSNVLKDLPNSRERFFCQNTYEAQLGLRVTDKIKSGGERKLPDNEMLVMALNEVAVSRGSGFFFHIRNRDCWKKPPDSTVLCPLGRQISRPR